MTMRSLVFLVAIALVGTVVVVAQQASEIRLAFVPNGMTVSWSTPTAPTTPTVLYGTNSANLTQTATGTTHTYGTEYFNDVVLTGLTPFTQYYYSIVISPSVVTPPIAFTTARAAGDSSPARIVMVGDMGVANAADTMQALNTYINASDFYYHIGDISYADDFYLRSGDTYEGTWVKWLAEMQPVLTTKAYMTLPGNHEATCTEVTPFACPAHQKNFTAYRHRFRMPSPESGGVENMWFSFDYGLVHFISISTETDFPGAYEGPGKWISSGPFGDQLTWLDGDLAKAVANRATVPWIIVLGHRPLYSSAGAEKLTINAFEPLFEKYDVDMYFCGHVHDYERNWPIASGGNVPQQSYEQPTAPVYIVNGAAGNVEGHSAGNSQSWTAFVDQQNYGYGLLDVVNSTQLVWTFLGAANENVIDTITINKKH